MSLEERCAQFASDAAKDPRNAKLMERLRKFIYRQQEHRFTAGEQAQLFQAVQTHVGAAAAGGDAGPGPALALLEDALKMPFTVFTTAHKKTMLKQLDKLNGQQAPQAAAPMDDAKGYSVLELGQDTAELMDDDGETVGVQLRLCDPELVAALRARFEAEPGLLVQLGTRHGQQVIVRLLDS